MKANDLIDMIGEAADEYIRDAKSVKGNNLPKWMKWSPAIAACLVLAVGIGSYLLPRMGGASSPGSTAGVSGHDEGSIFMSYAGPVFPLTLREKNAVISAQRNITMDFLPWVPVWISNEEEFESRSNLTEKDRQEFMETYNKWYPEGGRYESSENIIVSDSYVLSNRSAQDQTVRILYPFASTLVGLYRTRPTLTLDGKVQETILHIGSYSGGFQGAWENWAETGENPGSLNLAQIVSWEEYQSLLTDGTYLQRALGEFAELSHIPVTVYTFTDAWGPKQDSSAGIPNPSMRVMFEMDNEKTKLLSYGFHSGYNDQEAGIMGRGFSIREEHERNYGIPYYLIVIGDDIENMTCQGYVTGGWDTKKMVEAGVTITRTESDLETALKSAAKYNYQEMVDAGNYFESDSEYGFELYFGLMKEHLLAYGILAEDTAARYDSGYIEELDVVGVDRVFWLESEIIIPAGESVVLEATFEKEPSYDFHCTATDNKGVSGYDLVTMLGSNLTFTQQTACLEDRGQIEIVRQNFGFDLPDGIKKVVLDVIKPHYYLEVKSAPVD